MVDIFKNFMENTQKLITKNVRKVIISFVSLGLRNRKFILLWLVVRKKKTTVYIFSILIGRKPLGSCGFPKELRELEKVTVLLFVYRCCARKCCAWRTADRCIASEDRSQIMPPTLLLFLSSGG